MKKILTAFVAAAALLWLTPAISDTVATYSILHGATATGAGSAVQMTHDPQLANLGHTFQCTVSGTGSVSATVLIQGSNDAVGWVTIATLSPSGTTTGSDGTATLANWASVRADVTAISGTSAAVTCTMAG